MYGLEKTASLSLLISKELTQLCFGQNEIILNFLGDVSITATSTVKVELTEDAKRRGYAIITDDFREAAQPLLSLLSRSIRAIDIVDERHLLLDFGDGHTLCVMDDSEHYESYVIRIGPAVIVV